MFDAFKKHMKQISEEAKEAFYEGLDEVPTTQEVRDAYKIFGLSNAADFDEVKSQYKALCKLYHPDTKANSDSEQFKRIKDAYDVLKLHYKNI